MRIESVAQGVLQTAEVVQPLASRMGLASEAFDDLYRQLRSMDGQGAAALYQCIREWPDGQGGGPAYRTVAAQLAVVLQVLQQLKADGLEDDPLYQTMRGVHTRVFGVEFQMKTFLQQVMNPQWDEDSREALEW